MAKLILAIWFSTISIVVSSAFISIGQKEFCFTKDQNGSKEFYFEYKLENGNVVRGKTLDMNNFGLHLLLGRDDILYWVRIRAADFENGNSLCKLGRIVERDDDEIIFRDELYEFRISISTGNVMYIPYSTEWDIKNICFNQSDNGKNTFHFTISSLNNWRKYSGTTYYETNNPLLQFIHLVDYPQLDAVYEVEFTDAELHSRKTFCKSISDVISLSGALGPAAAQGIDPNALKSLIG